MQIRCGYELIYGCAQPTPMLLTLNVHETRTRDLIVPDVMSTDPWVPLTTYQDLFGNLVTRLVAPPGQIRITADCVVADSGLPDEQAPWAQQIPVEQLPEETLVYLLGSRYCDTDLLMDTAWQLFGQGPTGWGRVQAIVDFVHAHVTFGYQHARPTKTAVETFHEQAGVCRDFAHLAITFCRCMNIPARYCTGYLGDIRVPYNPAPMDFAGWFDVYLGDRWYTFDARNHVPRIGRVLMARGRDAADCALSNSFGATTLDSFRVWSEEVAP